MLSNAYLLAKIGPDTAENEQRFAEIWQNVARGRDHRPLPPAHHAVGHCDGVNFDFTVHHDELMTI